MSGSRKGTSPNSVGLTFKTLVGSIRAAHDELAARAGRAVNITLTLRNWLIGCYIAEYEMHGADRSKYGDKLLGKLSLELEALGVSSCGRRQLYQYLRFYQMYPHIVRSVTAQFPSLVRPGMAWLRKVRSASAQFAPPADDLLRPLSYTPGDNPPVGILLCGQKDHALAEYTLAGMDNWLFVSKYQLHLPQNRAVAPGTGTDAQGGGGQIKACMDHCLKRMAAVWK